jgi:hypothetical protein
LDRYTHSFYAIEESKDDRKKRKKEKKAKRRAEREQAEQDAMNALKSGARVDVVSLLKYCGCTVFVQHQPARRQQQQQQQHRRQPIRRSPPNCASSRPLTRPSLVAARDTTLLARDTLIERMTRIDDVVMTTTRMIADADRVRARHQDTEYACTVYRVCAQ